MINDTYEAREESRNNAAETTLPSLDKTTPMLRPKDREAQAVYSPEITIISKKFYSHPLNQDLNKTPKKY